MATIKDIANRLGVSVSTVSKGLNGASDISDELRQMVLDTAVEMGYATKRSKKVENRKLAIFIENMDYEAATQFGYEIVLGFKQNAFRHNWDVTVIPVTPAFQLAEKYDLEMAKNILVNAKCQRPSVCNAAESLLVHKDVAEKFLPMAAEGLAPDHVAIHGCPRTMDILGDSIAPATDEDYGREYLGYEISCKVVDSLDEAIEHINRFNTGHSECIVTRDYDASQRFLEEVDAAAVYVNASTRFTDGFEFGFGAEIGISTQKLHARGPMGLTALTTTKYIIYGNGQVR